MKKEILKRLTKKSENQLLPVPSANHLTGKTFKLEDVLECFKKPAHLRETVLLVGGTAIRGEGNDIDLVVKGMDFPPELNKAICFRLWRAVADYFKIPYDETPKYCRIEIPEANAGAFTHFVPLYYVSLTPVPDRERIVREMAGFEVLSKSLEERIIGGYASYDLVDLLADEITIPALEYLWEDLKTKDKQFWNLMDDHSSTQVGEIIEKWHDYTTHVDDQGFYIVARLRNDIEEANECWQRIQSGTLKYYSIKVRIPEPLEDNIERTCKENLCWRKINKALFREASLTDHPANLGCIIEVLNK